MEPLSSVLLFPETEPSIQDIGKLLFFFKSLSYYLPTESDAEGANDQHIFKNLCTGYVPAPLDEDLSRFNHLLREMGNSRSDDLARLFSSAQAPIATGQIRDKDEASSGSVFAALHKDNENIAYVEQKERLWQARLILKLAEILSRRENEVRQGLARITSKEQNVFASLEGDSETAELNDPVQFSDPEEPAQLKSKIEYPEDYSAGGSALLVPLRIKAWAELFLADSSPSRPSVIVTTNPDSGSTILDRYENTWRKTPQKLFSLPVPTFPGLDSSESINQQYISTRNKLHLAAKENIEHFESVLREAAVLQDISSGKDQKLGLLQRHIDDWEEKIKLHFPLPAAGHHKLDFYCFPGISPTALFKKIFNLEPLAVNKQEYRNSILAILHV
jgi:hypothetical protein